MAGAIARQATRPQARGYLPPIGAMQFLQMPVCDAAVRLRAAVLVSLETIDRADALLHGRDCTLRVRCECPGRWQSSSPILPRWSTGRTHPTPTAVSAPDCRPGCGACATGRSAGVAVVGGWTTDDTSEGLAEQAHDYQGRRARQTGRRRSRPARSGSAISSACGGCATGFSAPDLFADPAWDILLDLAASRLEGRSVSVSSLCIAAAVPPTTALRWIRMMTDQQLLERRADRADARRMFVDIADAAFDQVCGWFALVDPRGGFGV